MFVSNFKRTSLTMRILFRFSPYNFDSNKDYFKVLGINKTASEAQIKSAFYKLAKQYHPDLNKGNQTKFKQINEAYSILSDNQLRKQYESARNMGQNSQNQNSYNSNSYRRGAQGYQHQDPFQNYRKTQHQYYGNPYEEYEKWRSQYTKNNYQTYYSQYSQREGNQGFKDYEKTYQQFYQNQKAYRKRQQQYARQDQSERQYMEKFLDFKTSIRRSFMLGLIISIMLSVSLFSKSRQQNYQYPPEMMEGYTIVDIRGSPYLQKRQYVQSQNGGYNYSDFLGNKKAYYQ